MRHAAVGKDAVRGVAAELEGEDARDVRGERQRLQIEHQLDVLLERIGHADRRAGQLARLAAAVLRLDALDAPLDLADVVEVVGSAARGRRRRACSAAATCPAAIQSRMLRSSLRRSARSSRRRADAEQHVEHRARVAHHRQRLGRRPPS